MSGLLIAAPSSGAGKTTITLGLLRALHKKGVALAPGKAGPDYIDPAYHAAASGEKCLNYDPWAMRRELLLANAALHRSGGKMLVIEAMMGLFDGAADGKGSPADLAATLGLSVILVVDCARMSHSVAALVSGFSNFRVDTRIAGVILNRVANDRHEAMLRFALESIRMPIFAIVRTDKELTLPESHLAFLKAGEQAELEEFIEHAAKAVSVDCDLSLLERASRQVPDRTSDANIARLPPPGQRVAVARDVAFAFSYEHMLLGWRRRGAEIRFFSPLADEVPPADSDAIYLPGGYPELHAGTIAEAERFRSGVVEAAGRGVRIYGECGGYMALGEGLIDAKGRRHRMLGLLPLTTSFEAPRRRLGYRRVKPFAGGPFEAPMTAHEFHTATIVSEVDGDRLFAVTDALDTPLGEVGLRRGSVAGSLMHLIDLDNRSR